MAALAAVRRRERGRQSGARIRFHTCPSLVCCICKTPCRVAASSVCVQLIQQYIPLTAVTDVQTKCSVSYVVPRTCRPLQAGLLSACVRPHASDGHDEPLPLQKYTTPLAMYCVRITSIACRCVRARLVCCGRRHAVAVACLQRGLTWSVHPWRPRLRAQWPVALRTRHQLHAAQYQHVDMVV